MQMYFVSLKGIIIAKTKDEAEKCALEFAQANSMVKQGTLSFLAYKVEEVSEERAKGKGMEHGDA